MAATRVSGNRTRRTGRLVRRLPGQGRL